MQKKKEERNDSTTHFLKSKSTGNTYLKMSELYIQSNLWDKEKVTL